MRRCPRWRSAGAEAEAAGSDGCRRPWAHRRSSARRRSSAGRHPWWCPTRVAVAALRGVAGVRVAVVRFAGPMRRRARRLRAAMRGLVVVAVAVGGPCGARSWPARREPPPPPRAGRARPMRRRSGWGCEVFVVLGLAAGQPRRGPVLCAPPSRTVRPCRRCRVRGGARVTPPWTFVLLRRGGRRRRRRRRVVAGRAWRRRDARRAVVVAHDRRRRWGVLVVVVVVGGAGPPSCARDLLARRGAAAPRRSSWGRRRYGAPTAVTAVPAVRRSRRGWATTSSRGGQLPPGGGDAVVGSRVPGVGEPWLSLAAPECRRRCRCPAGVVVVGRRRPGGERRPAARRAAWGGGSVAAVERRCPWWWARCRGVVVQRHGALYGRAGRG